MRDLNEQLRAYVDAGVTDMTADVDQYVTQPSSLAGRRTRRFKGAITLTAAAAAIAALLFLPLARNAGESEENFIAGNEQRIPTEMPPAADSLPGIAGTDLLGREWRVWEHPTRGLCLIAAERDYGCGNEGPVVPEGGVSWGPQFAQSHDNEDIDANENALLAYGRLPEGAASVVAIHADGRESSDGLVMGFRVGLWGLPLQPGDNPEGISYRDSSGREVARVCRQGRDC